MIRIAALIIGTGMLMTYTTTPIALTNAIEDLLSPLKKLHVPVHTFAMMMTIALRFIPTLTEETDRIMTAQKARGADFSSGGLIARAKALIHGGEGRTRMNVRHMRFVDVIPLFLIVAFGATLIVFNILAIGYTL